MIPTTLYVWLVWHCYYLSGAAAVLCAMSVLVWIVTWWRQTVTNWTTLFQLGLLALALLLGHAGGHFLNVLQSLSDPAILEPDAAGIIHSPLYGDYPARVPFVPGMDLMPGQSAEVTVTLGADEPL